MNQATKRTKRNEKKFEIQKPSMVVDDADVDVKERRDLRV